MLVKGRWNHSNVQMSSVCPFSEVKNLSTDFNRVFNKINAADFVTVVIWKSSRHYDEKSFEKIIHNYVLRFCLFDFFFFFFLKSTK